MPFLLRKMTPSAATLSLALAILNTTPQVNPLLDVRPAYQFFTDTANTTVPAIPANQTLYVATTGSDANTGLSAGQAKLTLTGASGAFSLISNLTTDWVIEVAAGTYAGPDATNGHIIPTKNMSAGGIYVRGTGTVVLAGGTDAALYLSTSLARLFFINLTIGNGTTDHIQGAIRYQTTTNCQRIVFEDCIINGGDDGATAHYCVNMNSVANGKWRVDANYIGDHAYKNCTFNTGAAGFVWQNGQSGANPLCGIMLYSCQGTYGGWATNRMLCSKVWVEANTFAATASGKHAFMWGSNTTGASTIVGNNTCTDGYFYNNDATAVLGHAYIIGDNAQNVLFTGNRWTVGGGAADANIQGAVFKNAYNLNITNNVGGGNTSSSGTGNTAGILIKACANFSVTNNQCTATSNGVAFSISFETVRPGLMGTYSGNTFTATGNANAKCITLVGTGGTQYAIIAGANTYTFTGGGVLTGSVGLRGVTCTTVAGLRTEWALSLDQREIYNDSGSVGTA